VPDASALQSDATEHGSEIMHCEIGKKLHEKETAATEAVGRYSRSPKGCGASTGPSKRNGSTAERMAKGGVDYSHHKEQCEVCQRG